MKTARKQHPSLGVFLALSSALLFGLNASTSKVILEQGVSPGHLVMFRSFVTALIAGVILAVTKPSAFRVARAEWKYLLGFGIVGVALMQWAYSNAVLILPVGIALLIEYTAIVMVPIASWLLFKEKIKTRLWIGVALVLGGLVIVSQIWLGGLRADGVGFAFLAAALLSVYFIMGEHIQRDRDTMSTLFYSMLIAGFFWFCATDWWTFDLGSLTQLVNLSGNLDQTFVPLWALLLWLGVMGTFAPMALSYRSLVHLSASGVGIASTAETVFAFIFGWLWLGEQINGLQTVGGLLVISGIVIAQTSRVAKEPEFVK